MILVPVVPLVSLVSVCVSVKCFGDSGACGAPCVFGIHCCFLRCCGAPGWCPWYVVTSFLDNSSASGIIGVFYFCEVVLSAFSLFSDLLTTANCL